jgi:hypothetical protein
MNYIDTMTITDRFQQLIYVFPHSFALLNKLNLILTSSPLVRPSKISNSVLSTNSNTRYSLLFLNIYPLPFQITIPLKRLFEHDDIFMFECPQHLDLSHCGLLDNLVLICVLLELFDSHYVNVRFGMFCLPNSPLSLFLAL